METEGTFKEGAVGGSVVQGSKENLSIQCGFLEFVSVSSRLDSTITHNG